MSETKQGGEATGPHELRVAEVSFGSGRAPGGVKSGAAVNDEGNFRGTFQDVFDD